MIDRDGCIEWKDVEDFERYEHEMIEDIRWANDGMDMVLGYPDNDDWRQSSRLQKGLRPLFLLPSFFWLLLS